jgi:hypothetical protein
MEIPFSVLNLLSNRLNYTFNQYQTDIMSMPLL